jgi:hypothetical protein
MTKIEALYMKRKSLEKLIDQNGACTGICCRHCPLNKMPVCDDCDTESNEASEEIRQAALAMIVADKHHQADIDFACTEMMCEREEL